MNYLDEKSLVDLGLLGVATLNENYQVTHANGDLAKWLVEGEIATESSLALVGMEEELESLRLEPGKRLNLPDLTFGEDQQQHFHTVNALWDDKAERYVVLTTMVSARENYLVSATQLARAKHFFDEQLLIERRHFKRIYENSPQLAVCFRENGSVVAISDDLQSGYMNSSLPESSHSDLAEGHVLRVLAESDIWDAVWGGERVQSTSLLALNSAGEWRNLEVSGLKAERASLGYYEAYFTLIDVTERNRALNNLQLRRTELEQISEQLKTSNHRFEQFATVAAHDLLSPLRRITRLSQIIGEEFKDSASDLLRSTLEELNKSAYQGRKLVNDVMELSRVAAMSSKHESLMPGEIMRIVEDEFRFDLEEIGAVVTYSGADVAVDADETLLFQIYRNLVSNAIKYREPTRALCLKHSVIEDDSGLRIEVADNGRGFDSEKYDVFGAFVRLVGKQDVQGTGIGLAIVKEAVDTLGWTISADAEEGLGATFTVRFN